MIIESLFYKIKSSYRIIIYDLEGSVIYSGVKDKIPDKIYYTIKNNLIYHISSGIDTFENKYIKLIIDRKSYINLVSIIINFNDIKYVMSNEIIDIIENNTIIYSGNIDELDYEIYRNYSVYLIIPSINKTRIIIKYVGAYNTL